jgi:urease beta subunit
MPYSALVWDDLAALSVRVAVSSTTARRRPGTRRIVTSMRLKGNEIKQREGEKAVSDRMHAR